MSKHNDLGKEGEIIASKFLENLGYLIIEKNYRTGHKEIDIIARDRDTIVFVEVKYRSRVDYGTPEMAVTEIKKTILKHAAQAYMDRLLVLTPCRFDIISIYQKKEGKTEIMHFKDAFY